MPRAKSTHAHKKVLDAAVQLFSERGIDPTSMDAIAEASGVSKATIYKHWQDKDALILEVMGHLHGLDEERPVFDSGDFRTDLIATLAYHPAPDRQSLREKLMPHMMAYAARNREMGVIWRARVVEPSRRALASILKRGEKRGILRRDIDVETSIALLLGPLIYRNVFLLQKTGVKAPAQLEIAVTDAFLAAYALPGQKAPRR